MEIIESNERLYPVFSKDKAISQVDGYLMPIAASPVANGTPYSVNGNPIQDNDNAQWLYFELDVSPQLVSQRAGTPGSRSESRGTSH